MVVLAQLAEHRIVVPSVVGSSPTFHPKTQESPLGLSYFIFIRISFALRTFLSGVSTIYIASLYSDINKL